MEHTIADIYALPDDVHAELFDGKIYYMSPPGFTHQKLSGFLQRKIAEHIDKENGNCEVIAAPFAVFLTEDDRTYVEPDLSVICDTNKIDEKGCHGAPDWIIEILSPSSGSRDRIKKLIKYRTAGVREYWIVNPAKKEITVHSFEKDDAIMDYKFGEEISAGIFQDFTLTIPET